MTVRRKVHVSDETVEHLADVLNLPPDYIRTIMGPPLYTEVQRIVFDDKGEPQVRTTTCCCSSPGALRRICARTRNLKNPCRCFCHARK